MVLSFQSKAVLQPDCKTYVLNSTMIRRISRDTVLIESEERLLKSMVPTGGFQRLLKVINELEAEVQDYGRLVAGESTNPVNFATCLRVAH